MSGYPLHTSVVATNIHNQKVAGYTVSTLTEDGQYWVQVKQKWDQLPEGGNGFVDVETIRPEQIPAGQVQQTGRRQHAGFAGQT